MKDYIIRATAAQNQIRAFGAVTTEVVETARRAHNTSPVATAALGRLLTAKLSSKVDKNKLIFSYCIATTVFFIMLTATHSLPVITAAIAGLGFFFAGIYPTTVSSVGVILKGSTTGMSLFLAIAALGGIVTPQVVGVLADKIGITAAILVLAVNAVGMLVMSGLNLFVQKKKNS